MISCAVLILHDRLEGSLRPAPSLDTQMVPGEARQSAGKLAVLGSEQMQSGWLGGGRRPALRLDLESFQNDSLQGG